MWSKITNGRSSGKGLRCKIYVTRGDGMEPCGRPARRYGQIVKAYWGDLDTGCIDCCIMHAKRIRSRDVMLTLIDRRRTANP